jgi:hypothetical protein
MNPEVFLFIVCDDVQFDPTSALRLDIRGVYRNLRSTADPPFPCWCSSLTAFALVHHNGQVEAELRITEVSVNSILAGTPRRRLRFVAAPAEAIPLRWRIQSIRFPRPGEYRVELLFDGAAIARWSILVTA